MLPKTRAYVKSYDGRTKQMYFLIEDYDLLKKYNTICFFLKRKLSIEADIKKQGLLILSLNNPTGFFEG